MAKEIGRLHSFGLGIETTSGTESASDVYIPLTAGKLIPKVTKVTQENGLGVIDQVADSYVTQKMSEFQGSGSVKYTSIGWLLLLAFGTSGSATLVETGVYSHAFTRKNDNNHPSATVFHLNATQQEKSVYHMLQNVDFTFEVGEKAMFSLSTIGRKIQNTSGLSAAFPTEEDFLVNCMEVRLADTVAGLSSATPISIQRATLSIQKNLLQVFGTSTGSGCEYEFVSQHNQAFGVSGDFELKMDGKSYQEIFEAGDYKVMQIKLVGKTLIGATEFPELSFTIPKIAFESFDTSDSLDEIVTQTIGFIGMYDAVNGITTSASLQNARATQYA